MFRRLATSLLFFCAFGVAELIDGSQAEIHARQSYQFARRGSLKEAETEMQEAIRLSPQNPLYHSALAGLYLKDNRLAGAKAELESAMTLNPPSPARTVILGRLKQTDLGLGAALGQAGQFQGGISLALGAAKRFPEDSKTWQMLGYFQQKLQLNGDAVRSYASALRLDPASPEASVGLGTSEFSAGMEAEAVRTLEAGIAKFPEDPAHFQALGVVLLRLAETGSDTRGRARWMFEKALSLDGSLPEAHYELGMLSLAANNLQIAKDHLLTAEENAPNDSRIHFALARLYRMGGQLSDSEREMKAFSETKSEEHRDRVARLNGEP